MIARGAGHDGHGGTRFLPSGDEGIVREQGQLGEGRHPGAVRHFSHPIEKGIGITLQEFPHGQQFLIHQLLRQLGISFPETGARGPWESALPHAAGRRDVGKKDLHPHSFALGPLVPVVCDRVLADGNLLHHPDRTGNQGRRSGRDQGGTNPIKTPRLQGDQILRYGPAAGSADGFAPRLAQLVTLALESGSDHVGERSGLIESSLDRGI